MAKGVVARMDVRSLLEKASLDECLKRADRLEAEADPNAPYWDRIATPCNLLDKWDKLGEKKIENSGELPLGVETPKKKKCDYQTLIDALHDAHIEVYGEKDVFSKSAGSIIKMLLKDYSIEDCLKKVELLAGMVNEMGIKCPWTGGKPNYFWKIPINAKYLRARWDDLTPVYKKGKYEL